MPVLSKQKKIIILYSGFNSKGGGVVTHSHTLKDILCTAGHEVELWSLDNHRFRGTIVAGLEKVINKILPPWGILLRYFLTQLFFYFTLKNITEKYDVVIFQNCFFFPVFHGEHIYYFNHGLRYMYLNDFPYFCRVGRWLLKSYELRRIQSVGSKHIYISEKLRTYVAEKHDVGEESYVLENFLKFSKFEEIKPWEERKNIAFVGFLGKVKSPFFMLEVAEQLKARGILNIKIKVIGDGPLREKLAQVVQERGLEGTVDVVGRMANQEVMRLLQETKYVFLPSEFENFPFTLIEGRVAGCYNIINKNLFLIPDEFYDAALPLDAGLWVEEIMKNKKPDPSKRDKVYEKYAYDQQVEKLLDILKL